VLTPVYRGNLNDTDQAFLRTEIKAYTANADYIKDSWDSIKDYTSSDTRWTDSTATKLSPRGYASLNNMIQDLKYNLGTALVYKRTDKQAIRLANLLQPRKKQMDYKFQMAKA
jgi:hypothetical protein